MNRALIVFALLLVPPLSVAACLWDRDTPASEAAGMPEVVAVLTGRFERNPLLYYDMRLARVSAELRKGPRGGGRDRDRIVHHTNGAEIHEFARKAGVITRPDAWQDPDNLRAYREAFCAAIREYNARGAAARSWTVQFVIRRCAYHMLDHAWEMEDRDLAKGH